MDLFLRPYAQVLCGGILKLLWLLLSDTVPAPERPDARTSVLGDLNPDRPAGGEP